MIAYTVDVICDRCKRFEQRFFAIPTPLLEMRDQARTQAHAAGWMTVMESGDRKDFCPDCCDEMKLIRKVKK